MTSRAGAGHESLPNDIRASFAIPETEPLRALAGGRVNATLMVGEPPRLIVQQVNSGYFADPQAVMENLVRVIGHLEWRQRFDDPEGDRWFPELESTVTGRAFALDESGDVWRAYTYLDGEMPTGKTTDAAIVNIAGIYGRFIATMDDFGGPDLIDTVPRFRDLGRIINEFDELWTSASDERRAPVAPLRERALVLSDTVATATDQFEAAGLRRRVLHNDTKLNNVLLRPGSDEATAVVDYDLVMHGYAMDDFGDFARSAIQHRKAAGFDVDFFAALVMSYVQGARGSLDAVEIDSFRVGPARICVQLAWRYLTDELRDAPALRVADPMGAAGKADMNLALAEELLGNATAIEAVVEQLAT